MPNMDPENQISYKTQTENIIDTYDSMRQKLKDINLKSQIKSKIKENDSDEMSSGSSQKTRRFDDNVEQIETILQENDETDIKLNEEDVTVSLKNSDEEWEFIEHENFNTQKASMINRASESEDEIQDNNLYNVKCIEDIVKFELQISQLQTTIKKYEIEFDNINNKINKHEIECESKRKEDLMRLTEELKKEIVSWTKRYEENQTETENEECALENKNKERSDNNVTRQRQHRSLLDIPNMDERCGTSSKTEDSYEAQTEDKVSEEISSASSQKTRKFHDNVKQTKTDINTKINIISDSEDITPLKISKKVSKQIDKKHKKNDLIKIIETLNETIEKSIALLKLKKYSQFEKNNMKKIIQLINDFQNNYYQINYVILEACKLWFSISELEYEILKQDIKHCDKRPIHNILRSHTKIDELQMALREFKTSYENFIRMDFGDLSSSFFKIQDKIETNNKMKKLMKEREELKKKMALSKERVKIEKCHSTRLAQPLHVDDSRYSEFIGNRSTEYKTTAVMEDSIKSSKTISDQIKRMLSEEYNVQKTDINNKGNRDVPITYMNKRSDNSIPRHRKNSILLDICPNVQSMEESWWKKYGMSNKTEDLYAQTDNEELLEKLNKIKQFNCLYDARVSMGNKLKETHKTKENYSEKISSASSQKTRKFDERMKEIKSIFNNKSDIKLDDIKKLRQMHQKHEEKDLIDIIKILKKTVEDSAALLKQKKYIEFEKNNMEKIIQIVNELQNNYYTREYENLLAQEEPRHVISEYEYEMQNFRNKKNSHDIIKYCFEIYKLKNKIKRYKKKLEIHKLKDKIETNKRKKLMKEREALKKKVASWKERYAQSQTALATVTANNQSAKKKLFEFKDCILHVASEVAVCIKQATTLIFDKFIMKGEEQSFENTKLASNCMLQQYSQIVSSNAMENLNNNTLMTDNEILPKMIETSITKIVDELSDKIKNLSNHEDISNDLNEESPKKLLSQVSKMLSNTDNENRKCELTKQLGDEQQTNVDNKSTNVEQVETNTKETHDMKETKKHGKDSEILPFYFTSLYSDILEDYCTLNGYKIHNNKLIDNSKFNELLEEDKNVNVDCKNIRKSPESTVSSKPSKSLKSVVKITPVEQCRTPAAQGCMCTYCNLSKTIFVNIEN